jgi:hypothetical protein
MNIDYNHSDLDHGLPLSQPWERLAMKDLCDIAHYLSHGLFMNPYDYSSRLRVNADAMHESVDDIGMVEYLDKNEVLATIGIHVNAIAIAADALGMQMNDLLQRGKERLVRQTPEELEALYKQALKPEKTAIEEILDRMERRITAKANTPDEIKQELDEYAQEADRTLPPKLRLKRWAKSHAEEAIAIDILSVLEDLNTVEMDYRRDVHTPDESE